MNHWNFTDRIIPLQYEPVVQYFHNVPKEIIDFYNQYVFVEINVKSCLLNFMISEWLIYAFRCGLTPAVYILTYGWDQCGHLMYQDQVTDSIYMFYTHNSNSEPNLIFGKKYPPTFLLYLNAEI